MESQGSKNLSNWSLHAQLGRREEWMLLFSHLPLLYEGQDFVRGMALSPNQNNPFQEAQTSLPGCLSPVRLIMLHLQWLLEAARIGGPRKWRRGSRVECRRRSLLHSLGELAFPRTLVSGALCRGGGFKDKKYSVFSICRTLWTSPQVQKTPPSLPRWSPELCNTPRLG